MKPRLTKKEMEHMASEAATFAREYGEELSIDLMHYDKTLHKEDLKILLAYTQRKLLKQGELH
tara:strand:+ start:2648 stop:2836 length:189 start_codon:yes stop_codon:yes gene_type:complete